MASNFCIYSHDKKKCLELKMMGDFDGTAAFELIHFLNKKGRRFSKVVIDTSNLSKVYPFGRVILENNKYLLCKNICLEFMGNNADKLLPN
jgi:hypothetical protein